MLDTFKFKGIRDDEKIIKVVHRNWFNIFSQYIILFLAVGVFFLAVYLYPVLFPDLQSPETNALFLFIENLFLLIVWIYSFLVLVDYYFDIWVITSERIINIEQKGLFFRSVSEVKLEKIQDISMQIPGFVPTIINFGDVVVSSASEQSKIIFRKVSDPAAVKDLIMKLHDEAEHQTHHDLGDVLKDKLNTGKSLKSSK